MLQQVQCFHNCYIFGCLISFEFFVEFDISNNTQNNKKLASISFKNFDFYWSQCAVLCRGVEKSIENYGTIVVLWRNRKLDQWDYVWRNIITLDTSDEIEDWLRMSLIQCLMFFFCFINLSLSFKENWFYIDFYIDVLILALNVRKKIKNTTHQNEVNWGRSSRNSLFFLCLSSFLSLFHS